MPRNRYPWPASRLDRDLVHELYLEGKRRRMPLTEVLAEAVAGHLNRSLEQRHPPPPIGFNTTPPPTAA